MNDLPSHPHPLWFRFPRRRVEKRGGRGVNPMVQILMGRDSSFASEQRLTGVQSYTSKDYYYYYYFAAAVLCYIKILGGMG